MYSSSYQGTQIHGAILPDKSDDSYLSDISSQDKPWDTHRSNAQAVALLYAEANYQRYADRIKQCSQLLGFAFEAQDSSDLKIRLRQAKFCRVRFCPVCQWRREMMWRARFFQAVPKIMNDHPNDRWICLTLTVKNCPIAELRVTLGQMNKAWVRLSQRKEFPALGFVKSVEVTRAWDCYDSSKFVGTHGKTWVAKWETEHHKMLRLEATDEAHPHFHCLLFVRKSYFTEPKYISQERWVELWKGALRVDYTPNVDVRAVKRAYGKTNTIGHAILETLKYSVKEADLIHDATWLQELTKQLHKTRAVSVGGILRQYISEEEPEDLIHAEDEENVEPDSAVDIWFGWREMVQRYVKTER
jgi:plasmid rolling circle replication initiator protein Rep